MKTLNEFENEVAIEYGFNGISEVWQLAIRHKAFEKLQGYLSEAAERYAAYVAEHTCRKQREICAGKVKATWFNGHGWIIDKDSILNAPLATDKNK